MASTILATRQPVCFRCACWKRQTVSNLTWRQVRSSHYDTLGVPRSATTKEIRAAFLKRSKEYHPDMANKKSNHGQFVKVNEAYSVLSKRTSRRDYDLSLAGVGSSAVHRTSSSSNAQQTVYHQGKAYQQQSRGFYDPQMYSMRDKTEDEKYKDAPIYGIRGLDRVSNGHIVLGCLTIMITGIIFHSVVVKKSTDLHLKSLSRNDVKSHNMWVRAKEEAKQYSKEQHFEKLKEEKENRYKAPK